MVFGRTTQPKNVLVVSLSIILFVSALLVSAFNNHISTLDLQEESQNLRHYKKI